MDTENLRLNQSLLGIHHITAMAGDPQKNIDFYCTVLGLRLVKVTVNYDDPSTYHFYYGNRSGDPGTIITFFIWPGSYRGSEGTGIVIATSFWIPSGTLNFWRERLEKNKVSVEVQKHFNEATLVFEDFDGMRIELVEAAGQAAHTSWSAPDVLSRNAIQGIYKVTMLEESYERTAELLTGTLGFKQTKKEQDRSRFELSLEKAGGILDLLYAPGSPRGRVAVGTVHHVAWRVAQDKDELAWREQLVDQGLNVSPVMDRQYFHSVYFREPGGVLFEIATDPPGFTVDEPLSELGTRLMLPEWLEKDRETINAQLPKIILPSGTCIGTR